MTREPAGRGVGRLLRVRGSFGVAGGAAQGRLAQPRGLVNPGQVGGATRPAGERRRGAVEVARPGPHGTSPSGRDGLAALLERGSD
jgi:hypothetical protein